MKSPVPDFATPFFFQVKTLLPCRVLLTFAHQPGAPVVFRWGDLTLRSSPHEKRWEVYKCDSRRVYCEIFVALPICQKRVFLRCFQHLLISWFGSWHEGLYNESNPPYFCWFLYDVDPNSKLPRAIGLACRLCSQMAVSRVWGWWIGWWEKLCHIGTRSGKRTTMITRMYTRAIHIALRYIA